jgi:DNA-binding NtrC family response regulator
MATGRTMLVIDDDDSITFALESYFASDGWQVDTAKRLDSALERLSNASYTLVLTDLRLSGCEGIEGLEIARHAVQLQPATHVILLTAFGVAEIEDEARRIGIDAVLHKPLPLADIAQVAKRLIDERNQTRAAIIEEIHPCSQPTRRKPSGSRHSRPPLSSDC